MFAMVPGNLSTTKDVVSRALLICGHPAHVLFDSESTHSFVAPHFAMNLTPIPEPLGYTLSVSIPSGGSMLNNSVYKSCDIVVTGETCT